jgi:hypothetical protein
MQAQATLSDMKNLRTAFVLKVTGTILLSTTNVSWEYEFLLSLKTGAFSLQ